MKLRHKTKRLISNILLFGLILQTQVGLLSAVAYAKTSTFKRFDNSKTSASSVSSFVDAKEYKLDTLINIMVEDAKECDVILPDSVMRCYNKLNRNGMRLPIRDIIRAMPALLRYITEIEKAPRPDAPKPTANNAIVGSVVCSESCDLSEVLALLCVIKEKVCAVERELIDTRTILCDKFEGTWTLLADIKETLTECCDEIKADIFDTQTIICEKINDLNDTVTICCDDLKQDIFDTRTIICDKLLTISVNVEMDFDGVFTTFVDLKATLTECCDELKDDIYDTQTIICEKINDFSDTVTVCCDDLRREIIDTRTIICDKLLTISVNVEMDFDDVFTTIVDLKATLTECCDELKDDIYDTQTIICEKINDFSGSVTVCCEDLRQDIFDTRTIICDKLLTISVNVEIDFDDVFTTIADLKATLTECCDELKDDIYDTQTIICEKINDFSSSVTVCCDELQREIIDTRTSICAKFDCMPIILRQEDFDNAGGDLRLQRPEDGTNKNYCLAEDVFGNLYLDDSTITVDFNDRALTGLVYMNNDEGIIKNGKIRSFESATGDGSENSDDSSLRILSTTNKNHIINMIITALEESNRNGVRADGDNVIIRDCCITTGDTIDNVEARSNGVIISSGGHSTLIEDTVITTGDNNVNGGLHNNGVINRFPNSSVLMMRNCTIRTGNNSGIATISCNGLANRFVIDSIIEIENCDITTGNNSGTLFGSNCNGIYNDLNSENTNIKVIDSCITTGDNPNNLDQALIGIFIDGANSQCVLKNNVIKDCGRHGIELSPLIEQSQIISNCILNNVGNGIRINNGDVRANEVYNNIANDNAAGNYVGVDLNLVRRPSATTGFYTNVCDTGPDDCDICQELGDLNTTLTDCCDELRGDIYDTQTILCDKFAGTFTLLGALCDSVNEVNEGTDEVNGAIMDTQTMMCYKFESTWTILDNICDKIDNIAPTVTIESLTVTAVIDLNGVFTSLADIDQTLTECCAEIKNDIYDTQTTILDKIEGCCECDVIITQEDVGDGGVYVITEPGVYCLAEDVTFTNDVAISIMSRNVTLALNNHTIDGLDNLNTTGIVISGTNVLVKDGSVINANNGYTLNNVIDSCIVNCRAHNNIENGFFMTDQTRNVVFESCKATLNGLDGFVIDGSDHTCKNCLSSSNSQDGFRLNGTPGTLIPPAAAIPSAIACLLLENVANENTRFGFNDQVELLSLSPNVVVKNVAQNNGANYNGILTGVVALLSALGTASAWANISN